MLTTNETISAALTASYQEMCLGNTTETVDQLIDLITEQRNTWQFYVSHPISLTKFWKTLRESPEVLHAFLCGYQVFWMEIGGNSAFFSIVELLSQSIRPFGEPSDVTSQLDIDKATDAQVFQEVMVKDRWVVFLLASMFNLRVIGSIRQQLGTVKGKDK